MVNTRPVPFRWPARPALALVLLAWPLSTHVLGAEQLRFNEQMALPGPAQDPVKAMPAPADPSSLTTPSPMLETNVQSEVQSEGLIDNLSVFLGLDGSKQPQDLGVNANFGGRFAINSGFPLWESIGLGAQAGTAVHYSASAVHVIDQIEGTSDRWQDFTTLGVFQRTRWGFNWGLGYDFLFERYYDRFQLGQWRGQAGYSFNDCDEIGLRFAWKDHGDSGAFLGVPVHVEPITQFTLYWKHTWPLQAQTTVWGGIAQGHGNVVFLLPENSSVQDVFVFGAELFIPLSDRFALQGAANFITPNDTGTVDAYLGLVFYPGGGARQASHQRFAPLLGVAGNPEFSVDLRR